MGLPLEHDVELGSEAATPFENGIQVSNHETVGLARGVIQVKTAEGEGGSLHDCQGTKVSIVECESTPLTEEGDIENSSAMSSSYFDQNFRASFYTPHKELVQRESSASPTRRVNLKSNSSEFDANRRSSLSKPPPSMNSLTLSRDVLRNTHDLYKLDSGRKVWELPTTSQREFRYHDDDLRKIRSNPYPHVPSLSIAMEGERRFLPEKRESYRRFTAEDFNANNYKWQSQYKSQPIPSKAESPSDSGLKSLKVSPNGSSIESGRSSSNGSTDSRFSQGTTSQSAYKPYFSSVYSSHSLNRPRTSTVRTGIEGQFYGQITSREHYGPPESQPSRISQEAMKNLIPKTTIYAYGRPETTYSRHINESFVLKPPMRYDPTLRIPDKIDWM
ncbi:uncharacterized protein LOC131886356 isoform X2 [Tigriopus californicus]|uniref:uncharacterized protein LOC131886356 isoform X2 n=1 Tax=Tigriopus californicus TaxID=6832 RepID=UPI0027DA3F8B|nr:uncharacterized protein LOC131886356 isoform X2 [Tigriopus californicus]